MSVLVVTVLASVVTSCNETDQNANGAGGADDPDAAPSVDVPANELRLALRLPEPLAAGAAFEAWAEGERAEDFHGSADASLERVDESGDPIERWGLLAAVGGRDPSTVPDDVSQAYPDVAVPAEAPRKFVLPDPLPAGKYVVSMQFAPSPPRGRPHTTVSASFSV